MATEFGVLVFTSIICAATVLLLCWLQLFLLKRSKLLNTFINTASKRRYLNFKVLLFIFNLFLLLTVLYLQYSITGEGLLNN
jgi:hypothetical protein